MNFCLLQDFLLFKRKLSILFWRQITSIVHPLFWGPDVLLFCCCLIAKLCLTLCDPMDCSLPGSSVHGILQARVLEWVAMLSSRASSQPRDQTWVSCMAGRFFTNGPSSQSIMQNDAITQHTAYWLSSYLLKLY